MTENQRLIAEFDKNSVEKIKVHLQRWKNSSYVDIRVYFLDGEKMEQPTKKGLCLSAELLPELRRAIEKAMLAVDEEGDASD